MKRIPALAGTLALLLTSPVQAGAKTYLHGRSLSSSNAAKVQVLRWRHDITVLRGRTWHYQDLRHGKRSDTEYLERRVHALPRLHRIAHYWWRTMRSARHSFLVYQRDRAPQPVLDSCTRAVIDHEGSGWNPHATNTSTGAYGLPQALPGSKMASAGADWADNPATQIRWMIGYETSTYGSPCAALAFWESHGWY